jgi:dethiobiotin synthetase
MAKGLFITGTDTEVGKTVVTAGLLRALRRRGVDAVSMKPVQTGAVALKGTLTAPDLEYHHHAAGLEPDESEHALMAPYLYEAACSPHLAGRMAGESPKVPRILEAAQSLAAKHELLLVEGAGGVYAPLNESATMLDLMQALGLPVVLVARRGLGTINHSLLSIRAIEAAGLPLLGVVFNEVGPGEEDFIKKDNPNAVATFGKVEVLGNVDYLENIEAEPQSAWSTFEHCAARLLERVGKL